MKAITPSWNRRAIFAKMNRDRLKRQNPERMLYSKKRLVLEVMRPVWRQRARDAMRAIIEDKPCSQS